MKLRHFWKARQIARRRVLDKTATPEQSVIVEALEPRVLLSADAIAAVMPVDAGEQEASQDSQAIDDAIANLSTDTLPLELVFVDTNVDGYQQLLDDLTNQSDRNFDIHIIEGDGFKQITGLLEGADEVGAIHIIGHGDEGLIELGDTQLSLNNLGAYEQAFSSWADALSAEADILFYGCDVAGNAAGEDLLAQLAELTGADVAASDDVTGAADLGGDWELEYQYGAIQTQIAPSLQLRESFLSTLDIVSGLVAHYEFEEGSGTTAIDSAGGDNTGTHNGTPTPVHSTGLDGSGALDFSGTDDSVVVSDAANLDFGSGNFSVAFWYNSAFPTDTQRIIGKAGPANLGFVVFADTFGDLNFMVDDGSSAVNFWTNGSYDSAWHHATAVRDGSNFYIYIDGSLAASDTGSIGSIDNTDDLLIGNSPSAGDFNGLLDDVRLYNRALSAADITELVTAGTPDIVVDTTSDYASGDANYGDTSSVAALLADKGADNLVTLREAIDAANNQTGHDTITFDIPGSGTQVINLSSLLPQITDAVTIDGTTQTDWVAGSFNPIVIDGNNLVGDGLYFTGTADGSEVKGLVVRDFGDEAIDVDVGADNITITGNFLGAFDSSGLYVTGEELSGASIVVYGDNATIGGTTLAERNLIAGGANGVVAIGATGGTISGNYIGTDVTGNNTVTTMFDGVRLENGANNITIGGATTAHRNVIAGVGQDGIQINGEFSDNNTVQNNWIGVSADGSSKLGVGGDGVLIRDGGDSTSILDNHIAGAGVAGIELDTSGSAIIFTTIQGNIIGTDTTGTLNWGSGENGILIEGNADSNTIGGFNAGDGNIIAFSGQSSSTFNAGILIESGNTANSIRGNSIYSNGGLGIDLSATTTADGRTLNDAGDADNGGNNLINWPVLNAVSLNDAGVMSYTIDTSSFASGTYEIDFYASTDRDGGQVEGARYLGSGGFVPWGSAVFNGMVGGVTLAPGEYVVATVTDASGNTSEFSNYAVVTDNDGDVGVTLTAPNELQAIATSEGGLSINNDGGNDTVLVADDGGAILGGLSQFTMEFQYEAAAIADPGQYTLASYLTPSNGDAFYLSVFKGGATEQVYLLINGSFTTLDVDADAIFDGGRHTISLTWNSTGGAWEFFLDGVSLGTQTGAASGQTVVAGGQLYVGMDMDSGEDTFAPANWGNFSGTLYDVRVFDDVRTEAEIAASFQSDLPFDEPNLVANWRFDALSSDGVVTDAVSGNNLAVTHVGGGGFSSSEPALTFSVDENAIDGTVVGTVQAFDAEREALIASLLAADTDLRYNSETGKFYKVVGGTQLWSVAKTAAESSNLNGTNGQLATIRSANENEYVRELINTTIGYDAWIGGTDSTVEGEWRWVENGSEADQFWQGDENGYNTASAYHNFASGQPNDAGGNEDVIHMDETTGLWRDADHDTHNFYGYVVEWSADSVLDATQALSYAIVSQTPNDGAFEIDSSTGQISVADGSELNFEDHTSHTVRISVTDVNSNSYEQDVVIQINDLLENNNSPSALSSGIELNTDGGNDAYLISNTGLASSLTATTVEITFAANDLPTETVFMSFSNNATNDELSLQIDDPANDLEIDFGPGGALLVSAIDYRAALVDGDIHSLAVSWDSTNGDWAVYIDGQYIESGTGFNQGAILDTTNGQFVFGQEQDDLNAGYDPTQHFSGTYYDVRIWDQVRSEAEIALNYQHKFDVSSLPSGLVANWQMDGFNGSNEVVDIVGGNNLSIGGPSDSTAINTWTDQNGGASASGNTITFVDDGQTSWNSEVNSATFSSLGFSDNYTVSFKLDNLTNFGFIIGLGITEDASNVTDVDYSLYFDHNFPGTVSVTANNAAVGNQSLNYVAGDEFSFYVNGTTIEYQHNGVTFYTATGVNPSADFYIDSAFYAAAGGYANQDDYSLSNFRVFDGNTEVFLPTVSTPIEDLHIIENAADGTTVGYVVPSDPDAPQDIVSDGQFLEAADPGAFQSYAATTPPTPPTTLGNWIVESGEIELLGTVFASSPLGGRSVDLNESSPGTISQDLTVETGKQYQVVFALTGNHNGGETVKDIRVSVDGQSEDFSHTASAGWSNSNPLWEHRSFTFTADDASATLRFQSLDAGLQGAIIADVQVIEIPQAVTSILNNDPTLTYDAATGKFYKVTGTTDQFTNAQTTAGNTLLNGVAGQLVTIESAYENQVIRDIADVSLNWIGASDASVEGDWRWLDGTADEDQFSNGATAINGFYSNWASGQPNGSNLENYGFIDVRDGEWGDSTHLSNLGVIIEWDASEVLSNFTFAFASGGDAGGRFAIDTASGEITVANGSLLDYETNISHTVTIEVSDAAGNTYSESMTIAVDNIGPVILGMSQDYLAELDSHGPLIHLRLGESSGTVAEDNAGVNDGTYQGSVALGAAGALSGDANTAVTFNNNEYIAVAHSSDFLVDEGTVQLWFKTSDITQTGALFSKDASGYVNGGHLTAEITTAGEIEVRLQSSTTSYYVRTDSATQAISENEWHHFAFSFGAGGMKLYIDGVLMDTDAYTGGLGTSSGGSGNEETLVIGASTHTSTSGTLDNLNTYYEGEIDEFAILNGQLSDAQILSLANSADPSIEIDEGQTLVFGTAAGNAITVSDEVASTNAPLQVFVSVNDGVLTLSQTTGLSILGGSNGSSFMTIHGTESDLNAAFEGMTFTPNSDFNGAVTMNMTVSLDADMVGHYEFESNANDTSVGITQHGTFNGDAAIVNDAQRGNVLSLDGTGDYVQINGLMGNPADITLAAWINAGSVDTLGAVVISTGTSPALYLHTDGTLIGYYESGGTNNVIQSTESLVGTGWRHVAVSIDAANSMTIYIDGEAVNTSTPVGAIEYDNSPDTYIGRAGDGGTGFDFDGMIDDARIYARALSSVEIAALAVDETTYSDSVAITVNPVNDAPYFSDKTNAIVEQIALPDAQSVTSADFDNDGDTDLVATTDTGDIYWYENDGTGGFSAGNLIGSAENFTAVETYDLDGDGDLDIVAMNDDPVELGDSVYVFTNNFIGSGTVSFNTTSFEGPTGGDSDGGSDLAIGDIDGDGNADIVGTFYRSINDAQIVVFEQNTLGVWTKTFSDSVGNPYGIELADMDGDGDLDIIAGEFQNKEIRWYENDGALTAGFTRQTIYADNDLFPIDVNVGDFDGDGDQDIIFAKWGVDDEVAILLNDGAANPTFQYQSIYKPTSGLLYHLDVADMDGDGDDDFILTNKNTSSSEPDVIVFDNDGAGNFTRRVLDDTASSVEWAEAADLDGDGNLDVISAPTSGGVIEIYSGQGDGFVVGQTNEDVAFGGLHLEVSDDAGAGLLEVSINVVNGRIIIPTGSVTVLSGGSSQSAITFEGTLADINAALNSFTYSPSSDFNGLGEVQVTVNDRGNTGGGALSASETLYVDVLPVNDAPSINYLGGDYVFVNNDGTAGLFDAAALAGVTDVDNPPEFNGGSLVIAGSGFDALDLIGFDTSGDVSLSAGVTNGSVVSVGGVAVGSLSAVTNSGATVTLNTNATTTEVNTLLRALTFSSTATVYGDRSIDITFNDGDGTANGGADSTMVSVTANVASATGGSVTTLEDTPYVYAASDFDFTGVAVADIDSITVTTLPANGLLTLNGSNVTLNQTISRADIDANLLQFVPDADGAGTAYATFDFYVNTGNPSVTVLPFEPSSWTLDSTALTDLDQLLDDESNFGGSGTVATVIQVGDKTTTVDANYLAGGDIVFDGFITDSSLSAAELAALDAWVNAGGVLISTNDSTSYDPVATHFSLTIGGTASSIWHVADDANAVISGPFGAVGGVGDPFNAAGSISYFDSASLQVGDVVIAVDSVSGEPTIVLREYGMGKILFMSDEGPFRANTNGGGSITTANDILSANIFAWAVNEVGSKVAHQMTIDVTPVNDAPTVTLSSAIPVEFTEQSPVGVDINIVLADVDDNDLEGATIRIATGFESGADSLNFTPMFGVTGSFVGDTLTLSGTATVSEYQQILRTVSFHNSSDAPDTTQRAIEIIVDDGTDTSTPVSRLININPVNDAPAGADNTVTTLEDTDYVFSAADFGFSDSDSNTLSAVTITTIPTNGVLYIDANGDGSVDGGETVSATGSVALADITAGRLKFKPAADANGTGYDSFTFQVQDDGGTANGGVDLDQTPNTLTIDVTSVNDAPAGTNNTVTTLEDTDYTFAAGDFGFSDTADSDALTAVYITTIPANGTLFIDTNGDGIVDGGEAVSATDTIAIADITAGRLKFKPAADANGTGYDSFTFQVQDDGGTANGGVDLDQTPNTMTIDVTSVNDAPAGTNNTVTTLEDTDYTFAAGDFGFSDTADSDALTAVYITTIPANGTLFIDSNGDGIIDGGEAVSATDTIAIADITAGRLKFKPAADANGTGYDSFTFQVQDDGGTANGGIDLDQSPNTITIDVTSVNDAPAGTNNTVTTLEDTDYTFAAGDFGFSDTADSDALAAVYITTIPANGTLFIDTNGDGIVDGDEAVSATDTIAIADITAGRLKFKPAADANGSTYDSFTFQVQDDGGTANGGVDVDQTPNTMTIDVTSVNDAPAGTNNTVTTLEDTDYTFAAGDFGFSDTADSDALTAVYITTIPANGTLFIDSNGDGIVDGGEAVSATDTIAIADITAGRLKFKPAADANGTGYDSFTFQVQDDGGTANSGIDTDQTSNTLTIDVTSVNDAPAGTNNTVTTSEDTDYTFAAGDFGFSDTADSDALAAVYIATLPTNGTLFIDSNGDGIVDGGEAVSATDSIAIADITAGRLKFKPATDASGTAYDAFTFQVQDDGGTANGGVDTDQTPNTITIDVAAVNDAPQGSNTTVSTDEDTDYVFAAADFGFSDPVEGDSFFSVILTTLPSNGTLYIDHNGDGNIDGIETFSAGNEVAVTDINAGRLKFKPVADENGTGYDSFTFQVRDDGGTASGGIDIDQTPNTITIDVDAVNDIPQRLTGTVNNLTVNEDSGFTSLGLGSVTYSPGGGAAEASQTLTYQVTVLPDPVLFGRIFLADGTTQVSTGVYTLTQIQGMQFRPEADVSGGPSFFNYQVIDNGGTGNGGNDTLGESIQLNITPVNDSDPVADDESFTVVEGGTATEADLDAGATLLDGDTDADLPDDTLTISLDTGPAHASAFTLNADGTFSYTHDGTENLSDSFTYTLSDANGGVTDTGTVTITVTPVNDNDPIANDDSITVNEGATATVLDSAATSVLTNDTDADLPNDSLTVSIGAGPNFAGAFTLNTDGTFSYTHDGSENLSDSFTYIVSDADGGVTDTGTVTITVTPVNDNDPVADDESFTVAEGGTATEADLDAGATLLVGDTDVDLPNDTLTISLDTGPAHASAFTLNADGTFSYTHDGSENFSDSFTYTLADADGGVTDTGTVTITITPVNDNDPVADDESFTVAEGGTATEADLDAGATLLVGDTDADLPNDSLTISLDTGPAHASAFTLNTDGTFSYTHDGSENFTDSFTYTLTDADGGVTDTGTVTITITPVNDNDPLANNDSITVNEGATATVLDSAASSVLTNDTDADLPNDTLTVSIGAGPSFAGAFTLNADGTFSYTHDGSENFTDSFTYIVSDANGGVTDTGTVNIGINPVNDNDPIADNESFTVAEGGTATEADLDVGATLLVGDTDTDLPNDALSISLNTGPVHASAFTLNADGTFSYTHDGSENFTDSFTYTLSDADGGVTDTGTVTITITPVNDNDPVANNDAITLNEGATATALNSAATSVLANDTDTDLPNDALSVAIGSGPSHAGAFTLNADGTFSYTHDGSENLSDSFTYIVSDADGGVTDTGTVTINVNPVNDNDPVANDDSISVLTGASVMVLNSGANSVLLNDGDLDLPNDTLTASILAGPSFASSFGLNPDGTFFYTHNGGVATSDSFTYLVTDADGGITDTATVSITITDPTPANNPPVITSNGGGASASIAVPVNQAFVTSVNASDVDGDSISYSILSGNTGNLSIDPVTGDILLLDTTVTASYVIDVAATDSAGNSDVQRLTITAPGVPEVPIVIPPPPPPPTDGGPPDGTNDPQDTDEPSFGPDTIASEPDNAAKSEPESGQEGDAGSEVPIVKVQKVALKDFNNRFVGRYADYGDSVLPSDESGNYQGSLDENIWDRDSMLNALSLEIDVVTADMIERVEQASYLEVNTRHSVEMVSLVAIAGLMNIILKGSGLIGAAMTSLPLWRWVDPMPILSADSDSRKRFEAAKEEGDKYEKHLDELSEDTSNEEPRVS